MKLGQHVTPLPSHFSHLPILKKYKGFLFIQQIYLQKEIYENLLSEKPEHVNIGYLIHEQTHYTRTKSMGVFKFGILYLLSKKGRFNEELIAYKAQMKYLKSNNQTYDTSRTAKALSSWPYLWCMSYEKAKMALDSVWAEM